MTGRGWSMPRDRTGSPGTRSLEELVGEFHHHHGVWHEGDLVAIVRELTNCIMTLCCTCLHFWLFVFFSSQLPSVCWYGHDPDEWLSQVEGENGIIYQNRILFHAFSLSLSPPVCSTWWSRSLCPPPSRMITNYDLGFASFFHLIISIIKLILLFAHIPHKIPRHCSCTRLNNYETNLMVYHCTS